MEVRKLWERNTKHMKQLEKQKIEWQYLNLWSVKTLNTNGLHSPIKQTNKNQNIRAKQKRKIGMNFFRSGPIYIKYTRNS